MRAAAIAAVKTTTEVHCQRDAEFSKDVDAVEERAGDSLRSDSWFKDWSSRCGSPGR